MYAWWTLLSQCSTEQICAIDRYVCLLVRSSFPIILGAQKRALATTNALCTQTKNIQEELT